MQDGATGVTVPRAIAVCGASSTASPGLAETVAYRLRSCETLEQLLIGKRAVRLAAIAQDNVVEDFDAEGLSGQHEAGATRRSRVDRSADCCAAKRRLPTRANALAQGRTRAKDLGMR